ncbi:MAG: adenylate cyclase [Gammaproteobacteria bacterium]|jgi:adenylate cyclase
MVDEEPEVPTKRIERRLSAVFSTDVQGYSRLMGDNEEATILTLTSYREVFATHIGLHHGRVVDSPGDNLLAEFASAIDAVHCAVAVQDELAVSNAKLAEQRKMRFRIGINVGDVIVEGDRIYGDGVNIAARVEALADGAGIAISGTVFDQVEGKLDYEFQDLGEQSVKNIVKPVRVYRVVSDRSLIAKAQQDRIAQAESTPVPAPKLPDKPSIAVLPFANLSGDPEQEYFSDGMTEDLITDLSKISGLFIISRNSVFTYKGRAVKPETVSQELGVRYVVEGSVRKAGNRVRITAQLIDASTNYHQWAERYDGQLDDIFELQDKVIKQIVAALAIKLTVGEQARVGVAPTVNLEAYDAFVRARDEYSRRERTANLHARSLLERAIELDPHYAEAYAYLGRTYLVETVNQWTDDPHNIEQVFRYGEKAVELDPSQPTAHETLALALVGKKQFEPAIASARKAISFDPNFADGYVTLAEILSFAEQSEEAVTLLEQAMLLNPRYTPSYLWALGHAKFLLGDYDEAIALMRRVLTRNPNHLIAHMILASALVEAGQLEAAKFPAEEILRISPNYQLDITLERMPYKNFAVVEKHVQNLRQTGVI